MPNNDTHNASTSSSRVDPQPLPDNNDGKAQPCRTFTTSAKSTSNLPAAMLSPVRMEFGVMCSDVAILSISPDDKHTKTTYKIYLRPDSASIYKPVNDTRAAWVPVVNKRGFNFSDGSTIAITYHNGRFDIGIRGTNASTFTHDFGHSGPPGNWFVGLSSKSKAKWVFYQ
ncbi:uncharacterized protein LOC117297369 [Asterias rubens]|uniref:uncharacterized protein LOC117297369 n=1 Tax=Asterias rubens TaxID=7604 RepID=UPI0014556000|nr:uncharacterized protein LOC117297369 [Asterias rubens]